MVDHGTEAVGATVAGRDGAGPLCCSAGNRAASLHPLLNSTLHVLMCFINEPILFGRFLMRPHANNLPLSPHLKGLVTVFLEILRSRKATFLCLVGGAEVVITRHRMDSEWNCLGVTVTLALSSKGKAADLT
jgi:hypothetical protein